MLVDILENSRSTPLGRLRRQAPIMVNAECVALPPGEDLGEDAVEECSKVEW